ncbi:hypothetical protein [Sphingobacterium sp.]|uniref:hypothetical protein n=1 Tax=Sphingobacterium sp. TaxID=341027 RepID=UPI0028ADDF56|nr:hypothetical protein [Sphingobacterium sp.]
MRKIQGTEYTPLIEQVNPYHQLWKVRVKLAPNEDGIIEYMEEEFDHRPTEDEIKEYVIAHYNKMCNDVIQSGLKFNDETVWLSLENQQNYKMIYDYAILNDDIFPIRIKLGEVLSPVYHEFQTVEEIKGFYNSIIKHINDTLCEYWVIKDSIDWSNYEI